MAESSVHDMFRKVSIFADVDDDTLDRLAKLATSRDYPKSAVVCGQNEPGDAMFIICSGQVRVVLYGENGKDITLTFFKAGDFFGEMSLLDEQPRSANVITVEPSTLLVLRREDFLDHLKQSPTTAINIITELSRRLRKADSVIGNLALLDVYGRVARLLMELAEKDGEKVDNGILIHRRPTQQDIASMVNSSRETVSRVLNEFQKRGLLLMDGKKVILKPRFYSEAL